MWANYAQIDQISRAQGVVIATAKTQSIQSANDGVIDTIFVKEGQKIKKGDILITLENSQYKAGYEASESKVAALKASLSRLRSEVYGVEMQFDTLTKKYPEFIKMQKELFFKRQKALNDEVEVLNQSLKIAQEELNLNLPLVEHGDVGAIEILKLKRQISELQGQILNKKNKYFQDSQVDLTKAEEELSFKEQEMADKLVSLERTIINSSMDAIVNNIVITTQGAKVRPGDVILELVPDGDELILEAKLPPSELSFVQSGQKAIVKLDAYDYSIFGTFEGVVKHISPDSLIEKTSQGEKYYFRVLISLGNTTILSKTGKSITLTTGMTGQVEIITRQRTVLSYLTKPITKTLSESFTER
jgi:multidrug efflux pump subunit AcrA (membrane-fusion protein)